MAKGWQFILGDSETMEPLGVLKDAKGRALSMDMNQSGSGGCNISMDNALAGEADPWRRCIIAQRDDDVIWTGPISNRSWDFASGRCTLNAVGWFELLMARLILERMLQFVDDDAAVIVEAMLDYANAQWNSYITMGLMESTQDRTRTYNLDANIGQEIKALSELESGFDWYIDPVTRELNIVARRGVDRSNCKWLWVLDDGIKSGGNCLNVAENEDGMTMVNEHFSRGSTGSGTATDLVSRAFYKVLRQESMSLSDVPDVNILAAFSEAELFYRKTPRITYTITPKASQPGVPLFGKDFDLGDTTYLTARRGVRRIDNQAVRAFGVDLQIEDNGQERISRLQTNLS